MINLSLQMQKTLVFILVKLLCTTFTNCCKNMMKLDKTRETGS